jgi:catechol 2,3-dioxygenase-like lactoylglutathione lyase family enzyme
MTSGLTGAGRTAVRQVGSDNSHSTEVTMSSTELSGRPAAGSAAEQTLDLHLEVVLLGVSDVDRALRFYEGLGWRLDANISAPGGVRIVQVTPRDSRASIIFGSGITTAPPGASNLTLTVSDVQAARQQLQTRGADVSEVFHGRGAGFQPAGSPARMPGPDPDGGSYTSFVEFRDPDGNRWVVQEIMQRLPGRLWEDEL